MLRLSARPRSVFCFAVAAALLAGTLLVFGSLHYATSRMLVTM
jgi:hypothetical protein